MCINKKNCYNQCGVFAVSTQYIEDLYKPMWYMLYHLTGLRRVWCCASRARALLGRHWLLVCEDSIGLHACWRFCQRCTCVYFIFSISNWQQSHFQVTFTSDKMQFLMIFQCCFSIISFCSIYRTNFYLATTERASTENSRSLIMN